MEEWKEYKIGDVCTIKHGFAFKGEYFTDENNCHICITPGNFAIGGGFKLDKPKYYSGPVPTDYILRPNDIIVTMTDLSRDGDTLGYSALIPKSDDFVFLHNQRIGLVQNINVDFDPHFLYWILRTRHYHQYILNHSSGSTVKHTSPNNISSYSFRAPSKEIQRTIVSILDTLDAKIELNRLINENLEEQAQALFRSWFVDFEPWGGIMPEDWNLGVITDLTQVTMGQSPESDSYNMDGVGDIFYQGCTDFGDRFPNIRVYTTSPTRFAEPFSVLLSVRAPVGALNVAWRKCAIGRGLASIKSTYNSYVYYSIQNYKPVLEGYNGDGTVFGCIKKSVVENIPILIPNTKILKDFESKVTPLDKQIFNNFIECQIFCKEI